MIRWSGPPGVGRTRVAREALALALASGRPVRWAAATAPAAVVPLGALAHLVPAVIPTSDPLVRLQRAVQAIEGDGLTTNCCFGGDDMRTLYATDALPGNVVAWQHMPVAGLPLPPWPGLLA